MLTWYSSCSVSDDCTGTGPAPGARGGTSVNWVPSRRSESGRRGRARSGILAVLADEHSAHDVRYDSATLTCHGDACCATRPLPSPWWIVCRVVNRQPTRTVIQSPPARCAAPVRDRAGRELKGSSGGRSTPSTVREANRLVQRPRMAPDRSPGCGMMRCGWPLGLLLNNMSRAATVASLSRRRICCRPRCLLTCVL